MSSVSTKPKTLKEYADEMLLGHSRVAIVDIWKYVFKQVNNVNNSSAQRLAYKDILDMIEFFWGREQPTFLKPSWEWEENK